MAEKKENKDAGATKRSTSKIGTVVSDKMDKTVVVAVENRKMHPVYFKYVKRTSKFFAHDESNECNVGDRVVIEESRPLSRRKRWTVARIIERSEAIS